MGLSSNILWHQTDLEGINHILKDKGLKFAYSREIVPGDDTKRAYPMISLCDLPFAEIGDYLAKYGDYSIGFSREWGLRNHFNSVWYCDKNSNAESFIKEEIARGNYELASYVKPVEGVLETKKYHYYNYRYYDEREIRLVASKDEIERIKEQWLLSEYEYDKYKQNHNDKPVIDNTEIMVKFEWSDIKYIIVKSETQVKSFREKLNSLNCDNHSIGIFPQKRVRQDFIGVAHNAKKEKIDSPSDASETKH